MGVWWRGVDKVGMYTCPRVLLIPLGVSPSS